MTGVGHELPYPHLALLAGVEGAVDVVQHPVERGTDLADLGVRVGLGLGDTLAEVHLAGVEGEFGDSGGGGGDSAEGAGGDADDDGAGDTGGYEGGGGDAGLDEHEGVEGTADALGGDGDVVAAAAVGGRPVLDAIAAEAVEVDGVLLAVLGDLVERRLLSLGEVHGLHTETVGGGAVVRLLADLGVGDGAVLDQGDDRAGRPRAAHALGELGEIESLGGLAGRVAVVGVGLAGFIAGRLAGGPIDGLGQLGVQLLVQVRTQRERRHRTDHRTHHGDQHQRRDDEPRPQGTRLTRPSLLRTRSSSPAHDTAGLIR
jgi:hypothetical protein